MHQRSPAVIWILVQACRAFYACAVGIGALSALLAVLEFTAGAPKVAVLYVALLPFTVLLAVAMHSLQSTLQSTTVETDSQDC